MSEFLKYWKNQKKITKNEDREVWKSVSRYQVIPSSAAFAAEEGID